MAYLLRSGKITLLLYQFLFCGILYSQGNYKHYTSLDGLQHDITYNIVQDSKGYIWIGTDDGLSRFDGKDFKNYSLKDGLTSNYVMDVEELSNGEYAIATWGGGLHFLKNDTIYKNNNFDDANAKSYDIKHHENKIYTTTGALLSIYDLEKQVLNSKIYINSKVEFINESFTTLKYKKLNPVILKNKVYIHNKKHNENSYKGIHELSSDFNIKPSFPFLSALEISTALELDEDKFLFASVNNLIITSSDRIIERFELPHISAKERIVKILKTPNNSSKYALLIRRPSGKKRVAFFDSERNEVTGLNKLIDLKFGISDIMFDFENNLWVATFGNGIYCYYYSNPKVTNILSSEYFIDAIKNEKEIYALTSSQLYKFSKGNLIKKYPIDGFSQHISLIKDKLYVSVLESKPKFNDDFQIIGGRFFGRTKHFSVSQNNTILINDKEILINKGVYIKLIKEDHRLLSLYTNKGKWIYNLKESKFSEDLLFEKNLPSNRINDLLQINGTDYIATDKGLIIKDKDGQLKAFNVQTGMLNERINCLYMKGNYLYLGTQAGLSLLKNNKIYNFSKSFGIQSLAINKIIESDNKLWLFGNDGISIVNIEDVKVSKSPKLMINQRSNIFEYEVISYKDQNSIKLQYRINQEKWQTISNFKGQLDFNNFTANDYTVAFRAQSSHSDWIYSSMHTFTINVLWYKQWWVLLLAFISISFLLGTGFYQRLKIVAKRNKLLKDEITKRMTAESELSEVRDNIARDFHDDLGNKLASISLLSEVLSNKIKSNENKVIETIKSDADYLYKGTKDFIFSLEEKSNYLKEIIIYLSDFAEDYLFQFEIDFEVQSLINNDIKLPYYWSKQIIYIFKEAITNAAKHSNANNAKIIFCFENKELFITFIDDGLGFDIDKVRSNGLTNMKRRANKISCELFIKSSINNGTSIIFKGKIA